MSEEEKKVMDEEVKTTEDKDSKTKSKDHHHKDHESHKKHKEEVAPKIKDFETFTAFLDFYLVKKAPSLPDGVKDFLVKAIPWFYGISLAISVINFFRFYTPDLSSVRSDGFNIVNSLFSVDPFFGFFSVLSALLSLSASVITIMALPGLIKRAESAWKLVYYTTFLSALAAIFQLPSLILFTGYFIFLPFSIVWIGVGFLFPNYFLFQLRKHYK